MADSDLTELQPDWIAPARTALCIVDVQNDFASPDGLLGQFGLDMSVLQPAIENIQKLVASARSKGIAVIFVGLKTTEQDDSPAWQEWMTRQGRDAKAESAICRADTSGMDFYGIQPQDGDVVIYKTRYSAFFNTQLDEVLTQKQLDTLVFCGVTTECCVESSVRDAFHHDYHAIVVTDGCGAYEPELHDASLRAMAINFALLSDTQSILKRWEAA
ncbi:cysteine hydrolase [Aliiglaciecola sp. 2_MG-2023]|uniref:cysteine hydrolase family protein n=1 Tax=unclassified Aliiglaciecola TaxID=2593648 RepID=UPI0026E46D01|nr:MULTISPECIES: cysteine hydrolase [unclassified Aliiglaciecola]MDO6710805.1 cysteine hydrolase [Aliiglaciecola sp. 2_MG-2023]MDO6751787.1 cysteine hydrolase [Aliiglaciecola sp. 1_MG-2023]